MPLARLWQALIHIGCGGARSANRTTDTAPGGRCEANIRHNLFNELRRHGVPKFNAAVAAGSPTGFWRMSGHPAVQQALRNHYFDSLGLPRLYISAQA
jgi:hypothetical protein